MYTTLIDVPQLQALKKKGQAHMVFDCSFELLQPGAGDQQYQQSHIPDAVRADLDRHLSASHSTRGAASGGRHPLPARTDFASWLGNIGFSNNMQAVVYDRQRNNYCGRLWWMLKWVGHEAVAVLDGGLQAWQAGGGEVQSEVTGQSDIPVLSTTYALAAPRVILLGTETIASQLGRPTQNIVDARAVQRFRGEVEPLDPVAGHIPGALNRPFNLNFDSDGKFKPASQLRAEFETLLAGRDPVTVVHHCGSGVSAVPNIIAMEIAGLGRPALYAGSWSEWCSDAARPVAQS